MPEDKSFGKFSQQIDLDEEGKALGKVTKETDAHTQAMQRQTRVMKDNSQAWGRLRKEQDTFLSRLKTAKDELGRVTNDFAGAGSAVGGFMDKLKQGSTITAFYARKIDAMRKGQTAFAGTMVATTGDISKAMDQSQKYVNAVHDSYRSAHKMSGEFRVETKALQQAVDDLSARFATQIAVSGDMTGAIEGMRREALLMSKYLGTSMQDVMDSWQEQLQHSTMTLKESKDEMVRVTYQADKYAKEIGNLGVAYLKTGNIGKKEFLDLVRSVGKELRTGTVDAAGYARAIKGLLVEGKKRLFTTNEQRESAEALKRVLDSMTKEGSTGEIWGLEAAGKVRDMWDDLSKVQNKGLRRRLEEAKTATKDMGDFQQRRYIMNVLRGSAAGNAMMLRLVAQKAGKDLTVEVMRDLGGTNTMIATGLAEGIKNDKIAQNFDKEAAAEDKDGKGKQVEIWKKSLEDIAKAALTPASAEFKMYAAVHSIQKTIEWWSKASAAGAIATQGLSIGGNLLMRRLLMGGGARAAGGGLTGLFGGGAATAGTTVAGTTATAGTTGVAATAAGMAGVTAAVAGAGIAGLAIGVGADYGFGKALEAGLLGEREAKISKLEGDSSFSSWASRGGPDTFVRNMAILNPAMGLAAFALTQMVDSDAEGWRMMNEERVLMEGGEFAARKEMLKNINKAIADLQKREKDLTYIEQEKLKALKKEKAVLDESIGKRVKREKEEGKKSVLGMDVAGARRMSTWMKTAEGGTPEEVIKRMLSSTYGGGGLVGGAGFRTVTEEDRENIGQKILTLFETLPEHVKKKLPDAKALARAGELQVARERAMAGAETTAEEKRIGGMSKEDFKAYYKKTKGIELGRDIDATSGLASFQRAEAQKLKNIKIDLWGGSSGEGSAGIAGMPSEVTTNAKGQFIFQMPGRKIVLEGVGATVAVQNQKQASKEG